MEPHFQTLAAVHARRGHENCCRFATLHGVHQRVRSRVEHFRIDPTAGVTAELKNAQQEKTEVEVLPVVALSAESASFFFVGDATQVLLEMLQICVSKVSKEVCSDLSPAAPAAAV